MQVKNSATSYRFLTMSMQYDTHVEAYVSYANTLAFYFSVLNYIVNIRKAENMAPSNPQTITEHNYCLPKDTLARYWVHTSILKLLKISVSKFSCENICYIKSQRTSSVKPETFWGPCHMPEWPPSPLSAFIDWWLCAIIIEVLVTGQNGIGQNGTNKMVWTKW